MKKCIGCGKEWDGDEEITGSVCLSCHIKKLQITTRYYDDLAEAFLADPSRSNWIRRANKLRRELVLAKLKKELQERRQ